MQQIAIETVQAGGPSLLQSLFVWYVLPVFSGLAVFGAVYMTIENR